MFPLIGSVWSHTLLPLLLWSFLKKVFQYRREFEIICVKITRQSLFKTYHYNRPFFLLHIHLLTWLTAFLHPGGPVELKKTTSHCMFAEKINIDDLQRSIFERRKRLVQLTLIISRGRPHEENWDKIREFLVEICKAVIVFAGNLCSVYIFSRFGGANELVSNVSHNYLFSFKVEMGAMFAVLLYVFFVWKVLLQIIQVE